MAVMKVTRLHDIHEFWRQAGPLYTKDPVRHTVALTVLKRVRAGWGNPDNPPILLTIEDQGETVGAVFCTPPHPYGLSGMPVAAARPVAEFTAAESIRPTSAFGEHAAVEAFAAAWHDITGATHTVRLNSRLYRLAEAEFAPPTGVPGELTIAGEDDLDAMFELRRGFDTETGQRELLERPALRTVLAAGSGCGIWRVGGRPVSLAMANKPEEGMSRVAAVYTPPDERGHGYGSAVTAGISQWAIDHGACDVVLFTDLANPISNSIYQRIGYRPVVDTIEVAFQLP